MELISGEIWSRPLSALFRGAQRLRVFYVSKRELHMQLLRQAQRPKLDRQSGLLFDQHKS